MAIGHGVADFGRERTTTKSPQGVRDAIGRADAWRDAANRLANLYPHEWAELYKDCLEQRGLTS